MTPAYSPFRLVITVFVGCLLAWTAPSEVAAQTDTELYYTVAASASGGYDYDFTLVAGSAQTSLGWLVFGDVGSVVPSNAQPLGNGTNATGGVTMTSALPAGWTFLGNSTGGHTGPTFNPVLTTWNPTGAGDSISWSVNAPNLVSCLLYTSPSPRD